MKSNRDWNNINSLEIFFHGLIMGTINKLPGISGGLYSIVIGFYDHLMNSIKNINNNTFKNLFLFDFKKLNSSINGKFLFFLSIGMIISYFTTSKILDFFLINYELYVWSIFFGLILGSLYVLIKRTNKTNVKKLLILFVGLCFGLLLSFSEPMMENRALAFVFFCGFISICGITIPGLSGSFILILLGNYELLLVDAVNSFFDLIANIFKNENYPIDSELIKILIVFFLGSVIGLIILSKFLSFILKKYPIHLNHLIIGFVLGTLPIVWPWNKVELGEELLTMFNNFYGLIFILASFIIIILLNNNVDKKIYGLIGKDIDYSFSRNYFNSKFKKLQILENEYINFDLKNISDFKKINLSNIYGFNVTIPYKESIIPLLDEVSDEASIIGAVNTIKIINGKLKGYNTDYIGFSKSLKNKKYYHALIFGSGGACKAIQFSLMKLNIKFKVVSRQKKAHFINYDNLEKEIINSDLIINTTPLGTYPNVNDKIQIPYELINKSHTCYDLIYNPEKSSFLLECESQGATIKNGLEMLELQAEASWDIWNS